MRKKVRLKRKFKYFLIIYVSICLIPFSAVTLSKYTGIAGHSTDMQIAQWIIKVNNEKMLGGTTTLENVIELIPTVSANVASNKLAPGYGGYFDIVIDPSGTEVGLDYVIDLNSSVLPTDVSFIEYKVATNGVFDENIIPFTDYVISGEMFLTNNQALNSSDVKTFRIYWIWDDVRDNDNIHTSEAIDASGFKVNASVTVTQKVA